MLTLWCAVTLLLVNPSLGAFQCYSGIDCHHCNGEAGTEAVIGCGEEKAAVNFTYYLQTSNGRELLQHNSPSYLRVNLTAFYNGLTVFCEHSTVGSECYSLNITFPPQIDASYTKPFGSHLRPYNVRCPVTSNPPSRCSWKFFSPPCPFKRAVEPGPGVVYSDDGCEAMIKTLTANYTGVCFECMAVNELGNITNFFSSINFATCQADGSLTITASDANQVIPSDNRVLTRYTGDSLSLTCTGTAVSSISFIYWRANLVAENRIYCLNEQVPNVTCTVLPYSRDDCNRIAILNFTQLTLSDTGNYTCFIDNGGSFAYDPVSVRLEVLERPTMEVTTNIAVVIGVPVGLISLFIVVGMSIGLLLVLMNYCQRMTANRHNDTGKLLI